MSTRYNVGDRVVIANVSILINAFGVVSGMLEYAGKTMTISKVADRGSLVYNFNEDSDAWRWSDEMIDHEATADLNGTAEYPGGYDLNYYTDKVYNMFNRFYDEGMLFNTGCNFSRIGIAENVRAWYKNKAKLFELFRKHPNWNEEAKAIVFLKTEHRLPDGDYSYDVAIKITDKSNQIINVDNKSISIRQYAEDKFHDPETWRKRNEDAGKNYSFYHNEIVVLNGIIYSLTKCQTPINMINEENAKYINAFYPEVHAHVGQKTSRVINKLFTLFGFDKLPDYNRLFAKLADSLNPFDVERITVFSLNIIDFLLMSHGNSWKSCHTILDSGSGDGYGGCYRAGTLSYANDSETVIMYTVDKSYTGTDWCFEPKITRQLYFWSYPVLVQERLYPQCNDGTDAGANLIKQYRTVAEDVFATCLETPNLWVREIKDRASITSRSNTFMYPDWNNFPNWIVHIKKNDIIDGNEIESAEDQSEPSDYVVRSAKRIAVGSECYCTKCGNKRTRWETEKSLNCDGCNNEETCANCGRTIYRDNDDTHYIDGEYYCCNCVSYCEYHEAFEPYDSDEMTHVENYGYVCSDALDDGDFYQCYHCERWYTNREISCTADDNYVCNSCYSEHCFTCDNCGEIYENDELVVADGFNYCDACAGELSAEDKEEEAV